MDKLREAMKNAKQLDLDYLNQQFQSTIKLEMVAKYFEHLNKLNKEFLKINPLLVEKALNNLIINKIPNFQR